MCLYQFKIFFSQQYTDVVKKYYYTICISKILMRPRFFLNILYKLKINNLFQAVQCRWLVWTEKKNTFKIIGSNNNKKIIKLFRDCSHMGQMCLKNSDQIRVIFSPTLWLLCAFLCLPGSLELGCSWTAPQSKSP